MRLLSRTNDQNNRKRARFKLGRFNRTRIIVFARDPNPSPTYSKRYRGPVTKWSPILEFQKRSVWPRHWVPVAPPEWRTTDHSAVVPRAISNRTGGRERLGSRLNGLKRGASPSFFRSVREWNTMTKKKKK